MKASHMARRQGSRIREPGQPLDWLSLAATPTCLLMAWISAGDAHALHPAAAPGLWAIGSMTWMYLLMALFHLSVWTRLAAGLLRRTTSQHPAKEIEYATRNR
jgi:hypothetical protein